MLDVHCHPHWRAIIHQHGRRQPGPGYFHQLAGAISPLMALYVAITCMKQQYESFYA